MLVGLTYDLREDYLAEGYGEEQTAEFDRPDTIAAFETSLRELGFQTERIGHAQALVKRLAAGDRWELVFNIAEGLYGMGREALVPSLLEAYRIPYTFSDPLVCMLTLHKGLTKVVARSLGVPTPDFAVVETEADLARVDLPYPLFAKPVAEGTAKGITAANKIADRAGLESVCRRLLAEFQQPVLVERFLPGREVTVGITGTGDQASVVGVMEVILNDQAEQEVYSYVNKENCEELVEYRLVESELERQAAATALSAWRGLGCRDAGRVDLRADESGVLNFLEVNPLAGLHPQHSDLPIICTMVGVSYTELIRRIMHSACLRQGLTPPPAVAGA